MRIGKYPFSLIGNIDETPTFFDMALSKFTAQKGERESVSDKWTNAQMLPPTIIFTGKTEQTIRNVNIPLGVIVKRRKKACMNDDLIEIWV